MKKRILSILLVLTLLLTCLPLSAQAAESAGFSRAYGSNRYETAFKAADLLKEQLGVSKFAAIVVADGTNFADALSGSYLAAVKDAPILLVRNNRTTMQQVKDYIKANLVSGGTVYLLGGVNAVPKAMESGLDGFAVKRLGGNTRYDTNLLILKEAGVGNKDILVCTGKGFADSLSASAAERPILLVKDSFTSAQKDFLKTSKGKLYIIGGTSAVSAKVESTLKTYGTVKRLGGNTRYETSVLVAQEFFKNPTAVVLAYSQNFPDGLSGGALAAGMNAPLILTASGKDAAAAKYATEQGIKEGFVLGGATLINDKAVNNIFAAAKEPADSETPLVIQWDQVYGTDCFEAPYKSYSLSYHAHMMWSPLYYIDGSADPASDEKYVWGLATDYEFDAEELTSTITLREGCYWSDGKPITAADVEFTVYAMLLDPTFSSKYNFRYVDGYEALINGETDKLEGLTVEGNKITMKMVEPVDRWTEDFYVLPAHCFEGVAWEDLSNASYWRAPVTSGPYKFVEAQFPNYAKLTRNEHYWGEPAGIKNVTCLSFEATGEDGAIASMISGESHITTRTVTYDGVVANQIKTANPAVKINAMYYDNYRSLSFNMGGRSDGNNKDLIVNDANVRLAISLMIDEDRIADYLATTGCKVMGNPKNFYTTHEYDNKNKSLDLEKAKQLLDAAGWDYNTEVEILCYYSDSTSKSVLEMIKTDAAKIGFKFKINIVTEDVANAVYTHKNWDLLFLSVGGDVMNPVSGGRGLCSYGPWTWTSTSPWIGEKYDVLYNSIQTFEPGSPEYIAAIHELQKANYDDVLIIPIYPGSTYACYNSDVLYIPDTAFDYYDNVLDLHLWKMLK